MKPLRQTVGFLLWSLLNPICIAASFLAFTALEIYEQTGSNTWTFDKRFFPLYLLVGAAALAIQFIIFHALYSKRPPIRPRSVGNSLRVFLRAQRPFWVMLPVLLMIFGDTEGNVFGFIIFPLYFLLGTFSMTFAAARLPVAWHKVPPPEATDARETFVVPSVMGLGLLLWTVAVVWHYGPENGFGRILAFRGNTPQYAVGRIVAAVADGDVDAFVKYVDVDRIFTHLASIGGPDKETLLKAIAERKFFDAHRMEIVYGEWSIPTSAFLDCIVPKRNAAGDFTVGIGASSALTGESFWPDGLLSRTESGYRLTDIEDWPDIEEDVKKKERFLHELPALRQKAVEESQGIFGFELLPGTSIQADDDEYGNSGWLVLHVRLTNRTDSRMDRVEFAVTLKDSAIDETKFVEIDCWANDFGTSLSPGESRTVEGRVMLNQVACRSITVGRLVLGEILPIAVDYGNGKIIDLVKLPAAD
jgi:hypothetical protein